MLADELLHNVLLRIVPRKNAKSCHAHVCKFRSPVQSLREVVQQLKCLARKENHDEPFFG